MPIERKEQSSKFSSKQTKSIEVIGRTSSTESTTSTRSVSAQKRQELTSSTSQQSQNVSSSRRRQEELSESTSASSIGSDSTMRDALTSRLDDFFFQPIMNFGSLLGQAADFEDVSKELARTEDTFEVKLEVREYRPEEIQVKVSENIVTIEGKSEVRTDEHNFRSRQFSKKFTIPPGVKPDTISCNLSKDGLLKISAPIERSAQSAITSSQEQQSTRSAQHKSVSKTQQSESVSSSRKSSLTSEVSSSRETFLRGIDDELIYRPRAMELDRIMATDQSLVTKEKKFEMKLEVRDYKPEEVEVKVTKTLVKIEGKHESKFASRSFYKEFTVPYGVNPETITCVMTPDGFLTISAPINVAPATCTKSTHKDTELTSSTNVKASQMTKQDSLKSTSVHQKQATFHSDSTSSLDSNVSSTREATRRRNEDYILRSIMDLDSEFNTRDSNFEDISKAVRRLNEEKKFETKLEVPEYKPEELQVKIVKNTVVIEGKQETEFNSRSFFKKFTIPEGVKPESISSSLSPDGVLTISAPIQEPSRPDSSITSTRVQNKNVSRTQEQESVNSSRKSSVSSDISTFTSDTISSRALEDEYVLRPRLDSNVSVTKKETRVEDISKQVSSERKTFEVVLEVKDYKPEEVKVTVTRNLVKIEGSHETEFSSKSFYKEFTVPYGVKPETITCSLNPNGLLTISAPITNGPDSRPAQPVQPVQEKVPEVPESSRNVNAVQKTRVEEESIKSTRTIQQEAVRQETTDSVKDEPRKPLKDYTIQPATDFDTVVDTIDTKFEDISKEIRRVDEEKKFETILQVSEYKPEEIKVRISKNMVIIEAKQVTEFSSREFFKKFTIPQGVKPESITSSISPDGVLTISAPIQKTPEILDTVRSGTVDVTQSVQRHTTQTQQCTQQQVVQQEQQVVQKQESVQQEQPVAQKQESVQQVHPIAQKQESVQQVQQVVEKQESVQQVQQVVKKQESVQQEQQVVQKQESVQQQVVQKQESVQQQQQVVQQQHEMTSSRTATVRQEQTSVEHSDSLSSVQSDSSRRLEKECELRPILEFGNSLLAKDTRFEDVSQQLCQINEGQKFEMKLDVPEYRPEELSVKITDNMVTIEGKTEVREENKFSSRQFFKKFTIPAGVKPEDITSSLSPNGVMTISAPVPQKPSLTSGSHQTREEEHSVVRQVRKEAHHQSSIESVSQRADTTSLTSSKHEGISDRTHDTVLRPIVDLQAQMTKDSLHEDVSKEIRSLNEEKKFEMRLEVQEYKPEELTVRISNNMVVIEGKQERTSSSRSFYKKFSIPPGVNPENIISSLSPSGVLTISAPIDQAPKSNASLSQTETQKSTSVTSSSVRKEQQAQQVSVSQSLTSTTESVQQVTSSQDVVLRPKLMSDEAMKSITSTMESTTQELCTYGEGKSFEMKLEVAEYRPEEIEVKISNNWVIIEGKQEVKEGNSFRSRSFCKKFTVPAGVKPENITCTFSNAGLLKISGPVDNL